MTFKSNQQYLDEALHDWNARSKFKNPFHAWMTMIENLWIVVQRLEKEAAKRR